MQLTGNLVTFWTSRCDSLAFDLEENFIITHCVLKGSVNMLVFLHFEKFQSVWTKLNTH